MITVATPRRLRLATAALLAGGAWLTACDVITGGCGDELGDAEPVTYVDGTTQDGVYRSSSWDASDWIDFPPGIRVRFEHGFGAEPRSWQAYVATARQGDGSSLVLAAGSEVELVAIDSESVTVQNATCVDFIVMVATATASP